MMVAMIMMVLVIGIVYDNMTMLMAVVIVVMIVIMMLMIMLMKVVIVVIMMTMIMMITGCNIAIPLVTNNPALNKLYIDNPIINTYIIHLLVSIITQLIPYSFFFLLIINKYIHFCSFFFFSRLFCGPKIGFNII